MGCAGILNAMLPNRRNLLALLPAPLLLTGSRQEPKMAAKLAPVGSTVFLVRHAETEGDTRQGGDEVLSEVGQSRALDLSQLLREAGVTHLFCSEYTRTRQTLAPLEKMLGLEVQGIGARDMEDQLKALYELPAGSVAVVAGHSNTVPALVRRLSGVDRKDDPLKIGHDEHERLFQVFGAKERALAPLSLELRYGAWK